MELWQCKQIRTAFHPESRKAAAMDGRDKAFMLRHALRTHAKQQRVTDL